MADGNTQRTDGQATLARVEGARVDRALERHASERLPRLRRLWAYYRNPEVGVVADRGPASVGVSPALTGLEALDGGVGEGGWVGAPGRRRVAQEFGLPARLRGVRDALGDDRADAGREVVIENDIGWRVDTMIDFLFGQPIRVLSTCGDEAKKALIERVLERVWESSGGTALLQDMALLGHVYGFVDLVLRWDERLAMAAGSAGLVDAEEIAEAAAAALRVEVVEPTRSAAVVSAEDYRRIDAYSIRFEREGASAPRGDSYERTSAWRWLGLTNRTGGGSAFGSGSGSTSREVVTEVIRADGRRAYVDGRLAGEWSGPVAQALGRVPVVHVQNMSQPFRYEGVSEVEQLLALQDELNTRLSDRASRVTLQSFKMYLAKGLDGFAEGRVGPGQVWSTDNPDAEIQSFGGDAQSPSESSHIDEVREAMDKVSAVPPLAGGVIRAKVGNLSSATALRITLMGLLAKTARKRVTYGGGVESMSGLVLGALDAAGIVRTTPGERGVRIGWPDPVPQDVRERIASAMAKRDLGLPDERVLAELGESSADAGID
ncbi:MAG: phage portal protein [Planctomycetota bacterium]